MINNSKEEKIAVIMSTYNGEKYLREQIDSILDQKNVDVELFIRDDGSNYSIAEITVDTLIIISYFDIVLHNIKLTHHVKILLLYFQLK